MQNTLWLEFLSQKEGEIPFLLSSDSPLQGNLERGRRYTGYRTTVMTRSCVLYAQVFLKILPLNPLTVLKVTSPRPHNIISHCALLSYFRGYGYLAISAALPKLPKQFSLPYRHVNQGEQRLQRTDKNLPSKS